MTKEQEIVVTTIVNSLCEETKNKSVKWKKSRQSLKTTFHFECHLSFSTIIKAKIETGDRYALKTDDYSHWITIDDKNIGETINCFNNRIIYGLIKEIYDLYVLPEISILNKKDENDMKILKGIAESVSLKSRRETKLEKILQDVSLVDKFKDIFK